MIIQITKNIDAGDEMRRAVSYKLTGQEGRRATVAEVRDYLNEAYDSIASNILHDYRNVKFNRRLKAFIEKEERNYVQPEEPAR